ncbi:hypothetical protein BCR39DRAFT_581463 [Naematelia encephala]|uniref:Uncharacterized protein n=1 Tax=Naematelia encephala TaxID=71784 RepID=A0A1Y2AQH2_9TREE|nr:hypothetical protein BCR39DRAFT_581463 [Naematelia encephala]
MLLSAIVAICFLPLVYPFSFTLSSEKPGQCGVVNVAWQGGSPPFSMMIMPAFDYPSNITIPDTAWDAESNSGSYDWTVNYPSGTQFVALMSDSSGTGATYPKLQGGGVSTLATVQSSSNASACSLRSTQTDFLFYLNETSLNQCGAVEIYWDNTATAPVTILGVIPGGQIFQLWSNGGGTSLVWDTNIAASTQFILAAFDEGRYGNGGSSPLYKVGSSGNSVCIDDASPSSTPINSATGSPTHTASGVATKTSGVSSGGGSVKTVTAIATALPAGAAGLSTGAIAGIAIAAVVVVIVTQALIFWFCCRRQVKALLSHRREMREHGVKAGDVDLLEAPNPRHQHMDSPDSGSFAETTPITDNTDRRYSGTRSSGYGVESSISPFWDPSSTTDLRYSSYSDLGPPQLPHIRTDSFGSLQSISPGLSDTSPSLASNSFTAPLVSERQPQPRPQTQSQTQTQSSGSRSSSTKAQLVAALSTRNPDNNSTTTTTTPSTTISPNPTSFGSRVPPQEAPAGGFRYHDDAGRIDIPQSMSERGEEVEDLPPMYRPEWEAESRRASGDRR